MSNPHKTHEVIWLQVDPDGESLDPEQWGLEDDVTWCKDQINSNDVEYIRADKFEELEAKVIAQQARIEELHHALSMPCDRWNKTQHKIVSKAISTPDDLSALQATIQKTSEMTRERASNVCNELEQYWSDYKDAALLNGDITLSNAASGEPRAARAIAEAIRALPAVTLEDLK